LVVELVRAPTTTTDFEPVLRVLFREAWFQDALLYLEVVEALRVGEQAMRYQRLLDVLAEAWGLAILSGVEPWVPSAHAPLGVLDVPFAILELAQRRTCWQMHLAALGVALDDHDLDALASRFRLTPGQIAEATAVASSQALWRAAAHVPEALSPDS